MDLLLSILLLLVMLLISNIISHYIPSIPTALTQISMGILFAFFVKDLSFELKTEWFLLLFIAPLLYNDGRRFPREDLWKMRWPILANAFILVFLTTIIGGYFIHWLIPSIPLAAAFALAAILSPTDPVAVNGIAERIYLPTIILRLVRGESLINDASGLIAFNYAVAAVVTGYFSLREATTDFIYVVIVGAIAGIILGLLAILIRYALRRQGIQDVTFYSLLQFVTPFIVYIVSEEVLHASGVIAVVAAGIIHSSLSERTGMKSAEEQVVTENMWSIILFVLNGVVFLLLGLSLPSSMRATVENPLISNWLVLGYVLAIGLFIMVIRIVWSYCFLSIGYYITKRKDQAKPSWKVALLTGLTGVRGAITMAGVLSMPYFVASGDLFPERSLIVFIAGGVILFTLLAATFVLPLISKKSIEPENDEEKEFLDAQMKLKILRTAIKRIEEEMEPENQSAGYELIGEYKKMIEQIRYENKDLEFIKESQKQRIEARLVGLRAERRYIQEAAPDGPGSVEIVKRLEKSLDIRENLLTENLLSKITTLFGQLFRKYKQYKRRLSKDSEKAAILLNDMRDIQIEATKAAIQKLEVYAEETNNPHVSSIIYEYHRIIERLKQPVVARFNNVMRDQQKEELRFKAIEAERADIQRMYEEGQINRELAQDLRRFVNYVESVMLQEIEE